MNSNEFHNKLVQYVEENIRNFHDKKLKSLQNIKFERVLKRKNPYLFKAKNVLSAEQLVRSFMDAHLSSHEETIFGEFLEGLAIFINAEIYGGTKSSAEGIDLEFERDSIKYIVSIKSGPNWGNSSQILKMKDHFAKAKRILNTNAAKTNIVAVNGCCYGKDNRPDKGDYMKLCGQDFWQFISGEEDLYLEIIEPLSHQAKEQNQRFTEEYARLLNVFTSEFSDTFCVDGAIDWSRLVKLNSQSQSIRFE